MKILLVVPRYSNSSKPYYGYLFPLGLGYISSVMKREHDVKIINLNHIEGRVEDIINKEIRKEYDVVTTGHMGMGFSMIKKIIQSVKSANPSQITVLGGPIISSEPELIFKALNPDFGVLGEGEKTTIELLDFIGGNRTEAPDGIIHHDRITNERKLIENINEIPFPDMEGLGFEEFASNQATNRWFFNNYFDEPRVYPILASRSCPFQCTFCYHSIGSLYRERIMDNVFEEIDLAIKKYKINTLMIYDDLFSLRKERVIEFCERIKPYDLKWHCQMSVKTINKDLLIMMKKAGCEIIGYGFESYSQKVLKSMKKPITPQEIDNAFKSTLEVGMAIQANFIFGDKAETWETAMETMKYWKDNCRGQISLAFIQPYPDSEMYKFALEKGAIRDKLEFIQSDMATDKTFNMTENMSDKEIRKLDNMIQEYMSKYEAYIVPSISKGEKGYDLKLKCPFCKQEITYRNCYLMVNRFFFWSYLTCRNCNMRFNIVSHLAHMVNKMGMLQKLFRLYKRMGRK